MYLILIKLKHIHFQISEFVGIYNYISQLQHGDTNIFSVIVRKKL